MSRLVETRRELIIHDLSSTNTSDDSSRSEELREIAQLKKSIVNFKKEKDTLNRKIEALKDDITTAENANNVANANYIRVMRKLCELLGTQMNQDEVIQKIAELKQRVVKSREERDALQVQVSAQRQIMEDNMRNSQFMTQSIKTDILNASSKVTKTISKAKKAIQDATQIKDIIKEKETQYNELVAKLNTATNSKNNDPKQILNMLNKKATELHPYFTRTLKKLKIDYNSTNNLLDLQNKIINQFKATKDSSQKVTPVNQFNNEISLLNEKLSQRKQEYNNLQKHYQQKLNEITTEQDKKKEICVCPFRDQYEKEKAQRNKRLRTSLKAALEYSNKSWIVPKSHSDICQLIVYFAKTLKDELHQIECSETEDFNIFNCLEKKVQYVGKQNAKVISILQ